MVRLFVGPVHPRAVREVAQAGLIVVALVLVVLVEDHLVVSSVVVQSLQLGAVVLKA